MKNQIFSTAVDDVLPQPRDELRQIVLPRNLARLGIQDRRNLRHRDDQLLIDQRVIVLRYRRQLVRRAGNALAQDLGRLGVASLQPADQHLRRRRQDEHVKRVREGGPDLPGALDLDVQYRVAAGREEPLDLAPQRAV